MTTYKVLLRVSPPRLFGLADPEVSVLPAGSTPKLMVNVKTGEAWEELESDADPYRRYDERFRLELRIDGIAVSAADDVFRLTLVAQSADEAISRAKQITLQLFQLHTVLTGHLSPRISANVLEVSAGEGKLRPAPTFGHKFYMYDVEALGGFLARSSALLQGRSNDHRLGLALHYLALGDELADMRSGWLSGEDDEHEIAPLRFLQYWKALATIVGDPARDKDYQSRHIRVGLPRQFYRHQVDPLHDLRNRFDVAHVADLRAPRIVAAVDVGKCREVAITVIRAYAETRDGRRAAPAAGSGAV